MQREDDEYTKWVQGLKVGDSVIICHPWQDREVPGGRTEKATVLKMGENILCAGSYNFNRRTGQSGPYQYLLPPPKPLIP